MANCLLLMTAHLMTEGDLMPNSIIANSIIGQKIDFLDQDAIVCFVRVNACHANIDVNDDKQLF